MSRVRTLLITVVPSMIAGGLLFGSTFGHADSGRAGDPGFWPATADATTGSVLVAQADPRPHPRPRVDPWATPSAAPAPPAPPATPPPGAAWASPAPPVPPVPPVPPTSHSRHRRGHGVSVSIHDNKVEIDGIAELVQGQLDAVAGMVDGLAGAPPEVRERIKARVRAVRARIAARLERLKSTDVDKLGNELERMGDEIENEMKGLDKDLEQLGDQFGKNFASQISKEVARGLSGLSGVSGTLNGRSFSGGFNGSNSVRTGSHNSEDDGDDDDDDDEDKGAVMVTPSVDAEADVDMGAKLAEVRNLRLDQDQRAKLARLRSDAEGEIRSAKLELDRLSSQLHDALGNDRASEAEIASKIDQISKNEATIRKARILAWVKVRGVLHPDQRKQVEAAARKGH